jgi:hypothetical protein
MNVKCEQKSFKKDTNEGTDTEECTSVRVQLFVRGFSRILLVLPQMHWCILADLCIKVKQKRTQNTVMCLFAGSK